MPPLKVRGTRLNEKRTALEAELASLMTGDRVIKLVAGMTSYDFIKWGDLRKRQALVLERFDELDTKDQFLILNTVCTLTVLPVGDKSGPYKVRAKRRIEIRVDGVLVEI